MKVGILSGCALACLSLAACGGDDRGSDPSADFGLPSVASGLKTAEQVAKDTRGRVSCPPKISSPGRPQGAPVDDIVGVRFGMTYDEAAALVLCENPMLVVTEDTYRGFDIKTNGIKYRKGFNAKFAEGEKSSREYMREIQRGSYGGNADKMQPGMTRYYVATIGLPGQERVLSVSREEWFAEGKNPTVASVVQALNSKYGPPTKTQQGANGDVQAWWSYDPRMRPITETSPLYNRCSISPSPDAGVNLTPDCGVAVGAWVSAMRDNPAIAQSIAVASTDQANGYAMLDAAEQAFLQADEVRKAKELEDAAKNSSAPKL